MRLLLLTSLFFVSTMAVLPIDWQDKFEEFMNKLTGKNENFEQKMEHFRSRMSNRTRALFEKELKNVDLEERHKRLGELANRFKGKQLSPEKIAEIRMKLANIRKIKTEKPPNVNATDLFEVNDLTGVSDYLYQGDIHLTEAQLKGLNGLLASNGSVEESRAKRQSTTVISKWTDGKVYYYIDPSINERKRSVIAAALKYIQSRTCIRFYENSTNPARIKVFTGEGCYATLGMSGAEQTLSLGDGCEVFGTVAHEFTHALGVWHTQMRSDRDSYVTVDTSKIKADAVGNFAKLAPNHASNLVPYEYGSFMHYGANSFVQKAGQISILPADNRYVYTMGNRMISFYDMQNLNEFYGCSSICPAATSAVCQNGGVPNPNNCATCNCPLGYAGDLCNQRPVGSPDACGSTLNATTAWQSHSFSYGNTTDNTGIRDLFTMCTHWVTAPAGKTIQVRLTTMWNNQCQYGCLYQGIEFKVNSNPRETNPRICCPEFNNVIYSGNLNPMPIVAWNRYFYNTFTYEYRHI